MRSRRLRSPGVTAVAHNSVMNTLIDVLGWAAMILIVGAYALLTAGKIPANSKAYHWMNIAGAAGFIVNSGAKGAYPSAALNVIWVGIGIYALVRAR
jgi:hypothetical protein